MAGLIEILDDTIDALEAMRRSGVTHLEVSPETLRELGRPFQFAPRPASAAAPVAPTHVREVSPPPSPTSTRPAGDAAKELAVLAERAAGCTLCRDLAASRQNVVFGTGSPTAELMFIGEAPGHDEDVQGEPFVGRAGQLLTKIIQAMGLARHEVYLCNVLKCRPPENRTPLPDEVAHCLPFLLKQIELIQPKVIVALGATAMRALLDVQLGITKMRGHWYTFRGIPIMPTFHPAYLLRNAGAKREVWDDMQAVVAKLGREIPATSKKNSAN